MFHIASRDSPGVFPVRNLAPPGLAPNIAYIAHCRQCGAEGAISGNGARLPHVAIVKKLTATGWVVSSRSRGRDLCPQCNPSHRPAKERPAMPVNEPRPASPLSASVVQIGSSPRAEPPPQPTREDNRIIFAKLNEVYLDEARGYAADWSDAKIARDLDVPPPWVAAVREAHFGPDRSSEDARALVAEVAEMRKAIADLGARVAAEWTRIASAYKTGEKLFPEVAAMRERFDRLAREVERLKASAGLK